MQVLNCFREQDLTLLIADITSAGIPDALVDMDIRLTSVVIPRKHKQIICPRISQPFDRADHNLQQLLGFKILEILQGFNVEIL